MNVNDKLIYLLSQNKYAQSIGIEILELERGHGKARMKYGENVTNPYGLIHGGCLYSLADIVSGIVACTYGCYVTTLSGNMNYMKAAINTEYVYCHADILRAGRHIIVAGVRLTNDDNELLDSGEFTFYVTEKAVEA